MNMSLYIILAGAAIIAVTVGVEVDPPEDFPSHFEDGPDFPIYKDDYLKPVITPSYRDHYVPEPRNRFDYYRYHPRFGQCEETKRKLKNLAYELAYLSEAISALADKREDRPNFPTKKRDHFFDFPKKFYKNWFFGRRSF
ncbi:hypothetical protein SNE40_017080 [Patella caerulea]|uniref:Uncharacterized protein n=1 Tax=Patella caerulea TaxID=87958 RepID=A0AAN8PPJ8_PATCE